MHLQSFQQKISLLGGQTFEHEPCFADTQNNFSYKLHNNGNDIQQIKYQLQY